MADKYADIPSPKELRVIEKIVTILEGINPTNTYPFYDTMNPEVEQQAAYPIDLRNKVFVGRLTVSTDEAEDALSLLENPRPLDGDEAGWDRLLRAGDWLLLLQGWPRDNIKKPSEAAYKLAALAKHRLSRIVQLDSRGDPMYPDDYLLGFDAGGDREIVSLSIGQSVVRPPADANSRLAMFFVPLTIRLATNPSTPFL